MARNTVRVRTAQASDLPALLALAEELRDATNLRHHVRVPLVVSPDVAARFAALLADPDRRVLVAVGSPTEAPAGAAGGCGAAATAGCDAGAAGGVAASVAAGGAGTAGDAAAAAGSPQPGSGELVLGMALMEPDLLGLLIEHRVAHLSHLLVSARHRRRGAGRALLAAAVGYADEHGYDQIVVGVSPHSRDANRFFARLGFVPMVTYRLAPVPMLRRSLGLPEPVAEVRLGPSAGRRRRLARPRQRTLARIRASRDLV